jgi:hypothetical protein
VGVLTCRIVIACLIASKRRALLRCGSARPTRSCRQSPHAAWLLPPRPPPTWAHKARREIRRRAPQIAGAHIRRLIGARPRTCYLQRRDRRRELTCEIPQSRFGTFGINTSPCGDRVFHVAPFGYTLLEIAPLSLSRGSPATRWLRGVRLDRQSATRLGELRGDRGCLV